MIETGETFYPAPDRPSDHTQRSEHSIPAQAGFMRKDVGKERDTKTFRCGRIGQRPQIYPFSAHRYFGAEIDGGRATPAGKS